MSDAANSIRNVNSAEAVTYWEKSCEILITTGDLGKAARMKKTVAETYERDGEYSLASKFFYESADLFATEGELPSMVNQMKLKGADCATQNLEELTKIKESVDVLPKFSPSLIWISQPALEIPGGF
jgi:Soluble NSF attachment protein, SNAP